MRICSPMLSIKLSPLSRFLAWPLTSTSKALGRGHVYAPGQSSKNELASADPSKPEDTICPERFRILVELANALPDRQTGGVSMGWLSAALKETKKISRFSSPDVPCISFCGDQDGLIETSVVKIGCGAVKRQAQSCSEWRPHAADCTPKRSKRCT